MATKKRSGLTADRLKTLRNEGFFDVDEGKDLVDEIDSLKWRDQAIIGTGDSPFMFQTERSF